MFGSGNFRVKHFGKKFGQFEKPIKHVAWWLVVTNSPIVLQAVPTRDEGRKIGTVRRIRHKPVLHLSGYLKKYWQDQPAICRRPPEPLVRAVGRWFRSPHRVPELEASESGPT